jgi:hypothetical protein
MTAKPLPSPLEAWANISGEVAEARYLRTENLLTKAEEAIAAQRRLIDHDGERPSYQLALTSLERSRDEHVHEIAELRQHRRYENIYFALDGERYRQHSTPLDTLGHACIEMQNLFERICQSRQTGKPASHVPPDIKRQTQLLAHAAYPSSFGVHLSVPTQPQTDGYSLVLDGLEETFDLVNGNNPADLAARHGRFALSAFRRLVKALNKGGATPKAEWRSLSGEIKRWQPDNQQMQNLQYRLERLRVSEPKKIRETGTLAGASTISNRFEFIGERGIIKGRVPRTLIDQITACFNKQCQIWYEVTEAIDDNSEEVKRYIKLLGAERI